MQQKPPRPTGVTIIAVLAILGGIFGILGGLALIGLSAVAATLVPFAGFAVIIGAIILLLGLLDLAIGIGFLSGKGWAWTFGLIVGVISIIFAVAQIAVGFPTAIVSLIFWLIIIYYLTRTHVKAFFGKAPWTPPSMGSPMMGSGTMTAMGSSTGGATMIRCASCGASVAAGTAKCPSCGANL